MRCVLSAILLIALALPSGADDSPINVDVAVYGATPAGIAAAIATARRDPGTTIALITPYRRIGGLMTNGLTHPDFRTFEGRTGLFRDMNTRVEAHYRETFGPDSAQVVDSLSGTHAGPEVNHSILSDMIAESPGIRIYTERRLASVERAGGRISAARVTAGDRTETFVAWYFVDGTYEGDLMAAAGVPFRVGRESREAYGESLAPEQADDQVQGYNFRLTMTDDPANMAPVPEPADYDRADYLDLLPLLEDGRLERVFEDRFDGLKNGIYKRQTPKLPNAKRDINDVSRGVVRLSMPHVNDPWPTADWSVREALFARHVRHNVGMLYFLQNDDAVPTAFRDDARAWGLCKDEYRYNHHLPEQLYVREGRRMEGRYVFTQNDTARAPDSGHARSVFHPDAIAMGDYGPNCHGTDHEGPLYGGKHTGEFYKGVAPYQIPYGVILPAAEDNLAVPVACSASHVGFCALRLEPIWMSLGEAAGEAIALALPNGRSLGDVAPKDIQARLHASGAATIYTSDVAEESPDFAAVQWWGSNGGFLALDRQPGDEPAEYGKRGAQRIGQYYEAFPNHAVGLQKKLDDSLRAAWLDLAARLALNTEGLSAAGTRGEFIGMLWRGR